MSGKKKQERPKSGGGLFSRLRRSSSDLSEWGKHDEKLYTSVGRNDIEKMRTLLTKKNVNPGKQSPDGSTTIHKAAQEGRYDATKLFISHKVDVNVTDNTGRTPLHYASRLRHHKLAQLLLEAGANVCAVDPNQTSVLHEAALSGSVEVVNILMLHPQTEVDIKDKFGRTPLHLASQEGLANICSVLLDKQADANAVDDGGRTALMVAADGGHSEVVQVLIGWGSNIHLIDAEGRNAAWYAHHANRNEVGEILQNAALMGAALNVSLDTEELDQHNELPVDVGPSSDHRSHVVVTTHIKQQERPPSADSDGERPLVNGPETPEGFRSETDFDTAVVPMNEMMNQDGRSLSDQSDDDAGVVKPDDIQIRMDDTINLVPMSESAVVNAAPPPPEPETVTAERRELLAALARPPTRPQDVTPQNYKQLEEDFEILQAELQRTALENKHLNQQLLKRGEVTPQLGGSRSEIDLRDLSDFEGLQEAHEREVQELRDQNTEVNSRNRGLEEQLIAMGDCREYMEEELGKLTEFLGELKAETEVPVDAQLDELQQSSQRQETTINEIHNTIANLKAKTAAAGSGEMMSEFYNEMEEIKMENEALRDNNEQLRENNNELSLTVEKVQRQIDGFQELSNINEDLMKENDSLRDEYNKLHDHLNSSADESSNLGSDRTMRDEPLVIDGPDDLIQLTTDLQQENSVLRANNDRLVNQLRGLQHNVDRTMKNLPSYEDFIATKDLNDAQKAEIEQLKEAVAKQNDLLLDMEDELRKSGSGLDMEVVAKLLEEKRALQLELDDMRAMADSAPETSSNDQEHFERIQQQFTALERPDDSSGSDDGSSEVSELRRKLELVRDERNMLLMNLGESRKDKEVMEKAAIENLQLNEEVEALRQELDSRISHEDSLKSEVERVTKELNKRPKVEITKRVEVETVQGAPQPNMVEKAELEKAIHDLEQERQKTKHLDEMVPRTELIALKLANEKFKMELTKQEDGKEDERTEEEAEKAREIAKLEKDNDKHKHNLKEVKEAFIELAKKSAPLHEHQDLQEKYKQLIKENDKLKQTNINPQKYEELKNQNKELLNKVALLPVIEKEKSILNKEKLNALEENKTLMAEIIKLKTDLDEAEAQQIQVIPEVVMMEQAQMVQSGRPPAPQSVSDSSDEDDVTKRFSKAKTGWADEKVNLSSEIIGLTNTLKEQSKLLDGTEQYNEALAIENDKLKEELDEIKQNLEIKDDLLQTREDELDALKSHLDNKTEQARLSDEEIDQLKQKLAEVIIKTTIDKPKGEGLATAFEKQLSIIKEENNALKEQLNINRDLLERHRKDIDERDALIIELSKDKDFAQEIMSKNNDLEKDIERLNGRLLNVKDNDDITLLELERERIKLMEDNLEQANEIKALKSALSTTEDSEQRAQKEKSNIHRVNEKLLEDNASLHDKVMELQDRVKGIPANGVDNMREELKKAKTEVDDLKKVNNRILDDNASLHDKVLDLQDEIKSINSNSNQQLKNKQRDIDDLEKDKQNLSDEKESLCDKIGDLENKLKVIVVKELNDSKEDLKKVQKDNDDLVKDKKRLEADNDSLIKDIDRLREALYDKPIPEIQEPEQVLMTQSAPLMAAGPPKVNEHEELLEKLKSENEKLKDDINNYIKDIESMKKVNDNKHEETNGYIKKLEDKNSDAEKEMEDMKRSFGDIIDRIQKDKELEEDRAVQFLNERNKVQAEMQQLEDDIDDLRQTLDDRCRELESKAKVEEDNIKLQKENEDVRNRIEMLAESDSEKFKLLEDNEKLYEDLCECKSELDDLKHRSTKQEEEADKKVKQGEAEIEHLRETISDFRENINSLEDDLAREKRSTLDTEDVYRECDRLRQKVPELEGVIEDQKFIIERLEEEKKRESPRNVLEDDQSNEGFRDVLLGALAPEAMEDYKKLENENVKMKQNLEDQSQKLTLQDKIINDLKMTKSDDESEDILRYENEQLSSDVGHLKELLQRKTNELLNENENLLDKNESLEHNMAMLQEKVSSQRQKEEELSSEIDKSIGEIVAIRLENGYLKSEKDNLEETLKKKEAAIEAMLAKSRHDPIGGTAQLSPAEHAVLMDERRELKDKIEHLGDELFLAKKDHDSERDDLIGKCTTLSDENERLRNEIQQVNDTKDQAASDVGHLKELLQRKTNELLNENENILDKNESLEHEMALLQERVTSQRQKEEELSSEIDKSIGEIVAIRLENGYLKSEKDNLEATLKKKEAAIEAMLAKSRHDPSGGTAQLSPAEHDILMDERRELKDKIEHLGDELFLAKKDHDSERDDLIGKCAALRDENERLENEIQQLNDTKDQAANIVASGLMNGFVESPEPDSFKNTDMAVFRLKEDKKMLIEDNDRLQEEMAKIRGRLALLDHIRDREESTSAIQVKENHVIIEPVQLLACESEPRPTKDLAILKQSKEELPPEVLDLVEAYKEEHDRADFIQRDAHILKESVKDMTFEQLQMKGEVDDSARRCEEMEKELDKVKDDNQYLQTENKDLREIMTVIEQSHHISTDALVSRLHAENNKLEEFISVLGNKVEVISPQESPRASQNRLEVAELQLMSLTKQLNDERKKHKDVVTTYRTHLLAAVQDRMDPEVKKALGHIVKLRDPDPV